MNTRYKSPERLQLKEELRSLQQQGEAPEWLTWFSWAMLKESYLYREKTPREKFRLIASSAASYLPSDQQEWEDKFFNLLWRGWLSPSTPVMANMGTDRALAVSCSGSYVGDSLWDIKYTDYEIAMLSKCGFGTAAFFDVRPGMSDISSGGKSNPVTDWIEQTWRTQNLVSQGSTRRGSTASYMSFWHDELLDVLPMLEKFEKLHLGVICDADVKTRLKAGDPVAWERYKALLTWRARKGKPYIIFQDNVQAQDPECYKAHGWQTRQSQLCITGDQRVVSDRGYLTAKELHDQGGGLILFDNEKAVEASAMKLREELADVYEISLDNGMKHKVTSYHGIPVVDKHGQIRRVEAQNLALGDRVAIQTKKGLFGSKHMPKEAFLLGQYQADGTQHKDVIMLDLWEDQFDLVDEIEEAFAYVHHKYGCDTYEIKQKKNDKPFTVRARVATFHDCHPSQNNVAKKRLSSKTLHKALGFEKGYVPQWIWESDEETVWQYLRGLLYADGTVRVGPESQGGPTQLALASVKKNFLQELQLIFNNLGLKSSIRLLRAGGKQKLPDGKGGHKLYDTKDCYRLIVSNKVSCLEIEKQTGFLSRKGVHIEDRFYNDNTKKAFKVTGINHVGKEPVYCPTVFNDRHLFVCNGLLTFNCSEVFLHTDSDHTFSCVLSSMNATRFDEWEKENAVFDSIVFLDCINEDLVQRGSKIRGLERVVRFAEKSRALGLGLLGFHTYLQQNMIPLSGLEARFANARIFKHIREEAERATAFLGEWLGEPEICKGFNRRNSHLLAIAPNTSSSFLAGGVSQGIEPLVANVYTQKLAKVGAVERINPALLKILRERDSFTDEVMAEITYNKGSVQNLSILTAEEKEVFKTAYEINQKVLIDLAEQRQKWICQGQSLNLFFDADEDEQYIHEIHKHAFEQERLKSLYYVRTMAGIEADKDDTCLACEG